MLNVFLLRADLDAFAFFDATVKNGIVFSCSHPCAMKMAAMKMALEILLLRCQ